MMDKTVLNRAAARLSELWILYPFTCSNCKKTVSNQRAGFQHRMKVLLPIALTTWPLFRSVRKTFHRIRNFNHNCSAAQRGASLRSISFCKYRCRWRIADMAALGDFADGNQLTFSAAPATADIDAAGAQHQLEGILAGWFAAWGRCVQQFADQHDIGAFVAVEQKAEVADFNKAPGQHMQQKPTEKLAGGHGHDTGAVIRAAVFVGKADLPLIDGYQLMVGYGHAVGVTAQIVEHGLRTAKRRLGIDDSVFLRTLFINPAKSCGQICPQKRS
jgi:hypothetical protein